jgi:protein-disulfide isomerase/uncharacterized membrane protein
MIFALTILGLFNAIFLVWQHGRLSPVCVGGQNCEAVLTSVYATIGSVPIAAFGVGLFMALVILHYLQKRGEIATETAVTMQLVMLVPAAAVSLVLMGIQFLVIRAFCPFCLLNTIIIWALFVGSYRGYLRQRLVSFVMPHSVWLLILGVYVAVALPFLNQRTSFMATKTIGTILGEAITENGLAQSDYAYDWKRLDNQVYQLKKRFFDLRVLEIQAQKNQQTIPAYIESVIRPTITVTETEVRDFYEARRDDIPSDKTFADVESEIRGYLLRRKEADAVGEHIKTLYDPLQAVFTVQRNQPTVIYPNEIQSYTLGSPNAPVHIVEFSDLECGHCRRAFVEIKELMARFPDSIYFEYRHFPLPSHPFSKKFSTASVCAGRQDAFFEYIELAFANQSRFAKLDPADLVKTLDLDEAAFAACMVDPQAQAVVDVDVREGERLNVRSTPMFYINGTAFPSIPTAADIQSFL